MGRDTLSTWTLSLTGVRVTTAPTTLSDGDHHDVQTGWGPLQTDPSSDPDRTDTSTPKTKRVRAETSGLGPREVWVSGRVWHRAIPTTGRDPHRGFRCGLDGVQGPIHSLL